MGSDLYDVRAVSRSDTDLVLDVRVVHPDAMRIPPDRSFALMLLRDGVKDGDVLAREISFEDTMDEVWVTRYAAGFIRDVQVTDVTGKPPKAAEENPYHRYWDHPEEWMRGRLHVTVAHPAWIAHVEPGARWQSGAFVLTATYDDHPPIVPGVAGPAEVEGAFVWVPRECVIERAAPPDIPALFEAPAYASSAYAAMQVMKAGAIDGERLRSWIGKPVRVMASYGEVCGSLVAVPDDATVVVASDFGITRTSPESVGLLKPIAGRRGEKLTYRRVLEAAATLAMSATKTGTALEVRMQVPPDGRSLPIETETDVLGMLFAPLQYSFEEAASAADYQKFRPSPLSRALEQDLAARDMEGAHRVAEILPEIAKQYIASLEIEPPPATAPLQLDELSHADAREALAAPWPMATLRAHVTDEKWLEHFTIDAPRVLPRRPLPAPTAPKPRPAPIAFAPPDDRAVLWTGEKIWVAERRGSTWTAHWGKRSDEQRQTKDHPLASAEKAKAAFDKAVAAKVRGGYRRARPTAEAVAIVKKRLGLEVDDASGKVVVTKVGPPCKDVDFMGTIWCRPADEVFGVMPVKTRADTRVRVVEEIAIALEPVAPGDEVYVHCQRPATRSGGSPLVNIR